jgi:hypothetical protein
MSHPILAGHLHGIRRAHCDGAGRVATIASELASRRAPRQDGGRSTSSYDPGFYEASTIDEHAAVCLSVLDAICADETRKGDEFLLRCLGEYLTGDDQIKHEEALEALRDVALDGLFEFLDEHLDSRNIVLALVRKYQQRAEWFRRGTLRTLATSESHGRAGERALALDLYEYLLDQGVEFFVEPVSGSGEPDIVLREPTGKYVVLDAKYVNQADSPSDIRRKISSGFHQVARYCDDYQEPAGHLVVFSESRKRISPELEDADGWRFMNTGGRTIYYTEIWIADAPSASKLGKAEEVVISKAQLLSTETDGV